MLAAPRRFDLVGARGAGVHGAGLEVRVRAHGAGWSRWVPFGHGHAPDSRGPRAATDPIWAGGADELQLRSRRPLGGLRLHFVAVPAPSRSRALRAHAAQTPPPQPGTPPPIISRHDWGADAEQPRAAPSYGEVQVAFVHHTVSANDYQPEDSPGIVLAIYKYHRDTNGWNDIGYNFVVDKYGQVFEGRAGGLEQAVIGAHAQGYNRFSTGVANIGTYSDVPQTEAGINAMAQLLGWKMSLHGVPTEGQVVVTSGGGSYNRYPSGTQVALERISGHRDGDSTECPGGALYLQLPDLRKRATALAGPIVARPVMTIAAAEPEVLYGTDVELQGVLRNGDGTPAAGITISIQKQGGTRWNTVAHATTAADGSWSAAVTMRRGGNLRGRARLPGARALVLSPNVTVGVVPVLEAKSATRRVKAGSSVLLSGSIRPIAPLSVRIERQTPRGRWVRVADLGVKPRRAAFQVRVGLRRAGLYRLTPRTTGSNKPVAAPAVYVRAVRRRGRTPSTGGTAG